VWLACAQMLDMPSLTTLGNSDMYTGPLDIVVPA
jgi:hypothetical protein